jgi:hypothetical protein
MVVVNKPQVRSLAAVILAAEFLLSGCSLPTLVEVARRRQVNTDPANQALRGDHNAKDNVNVIYHVTDLDVLNFTDEVKKKLNNRAGFHTNVRYGSAGAQATLGALAGAATVFGWGVSTASGLGLGATYIFGLGQILDAKAHAQAYEQAFTAVQAAESTFYFRQVGMGFKPDPEKPGKFIVDKSGVAAADAGNIPRSDRLTPDGETLYYRVTKILKVLDDVLAAKIPDLQDLKDAKGDTSGSTSPTLPAETAAAPKPLKQAPTPTPAP